MLTNTKAREAKPRDARYEITCEALPGFILRVLPTGKKVFFVRYRDAQGMDHRERLGLMAPGYGVDDPRADVVALRQEAVDVARAADAVVVVLGLPPSYESEGYDRDQPDLPEEQVALIAAVAEEAVSAATAGEGVAAAATAFCGTYSGGGDPGGVAFIGGPLPVGAGRVGRGVSWVGWWAVSTRVGSA